MSSTARLLVVTPTLGRSPYLDICVKAIEDLRLDAIHILSCPAPMVKELQAKYKGCRVVQDGGRDGGMYEAINCGLKDRSGENDWFTYINDDDELTPGFATMFKAFATPENDAKVGYGDVRFLDGAGKSLGLIPTERKQSHFIPLIISGIHPFTQHGMLVGPKVMQSVGLFDSKFRQIADLDFCVRCMTGGFEFKYHPIEVARFRIHDGQLSSNRDQVHKEYEILNRRLGEIRVSPMQRLISRVHFRVQNVPRYIERVRKLGWASSEDMLTGKAGRHLKRC